jgi:hypothetical protein
MEKIRVDSEFVEFVGTSPLSDSLTVFFKTSDGQKFSAVFTSKEMSMSQIVTWLRGTPPQEAFPLLDSTQLSWFGG